MGFKPVIINLLLVGLFAIALLSGGIMIAINNHANQSIGDDPSLAAYKNSLESSLETATEQSDSFESSISNSSISAVSGNTLIDSVRGAWKAVKILPIAVWNLTIGLLMVKVLDSGTFGIVTAVLGSILTLVIVFGIIKLITQGEGE